MKKQPLFVCLLAAGALFSMTGNAQMAQEIPQDPVGTADLEQRIEDLETELEAMRVAVEGMTDSAAAEASAIDAITAYLQLQAKASAKMASTLTKAESMGFVAGINFPSRETLLKGWREQLSIQQKSVPGAPAPKEKKDPLKGRFWER